ncbi:hypothetical protein [Candidatus Pyrohabitans sp.]
MPESFVDKELEMIAENLKVFVGKDKETREMLRTMGLGIEDVPEAAREKVAQIESILKDREKKPEERINRAEAILAELQGMEDLPAAIKKLIVEEAMRRLSVVRYNLDWVERQAKSIEAAKRISYSLDLFLNPEDREVKKKLRQIGIEEVPEHIREVAKRAKEVLEDRKLDARERALRAADILMEPLQPALYGRRGEMEKLQHEIKCVLWEIANDFVMEAQLAK